MTIYTLDEAAAKLHKSGRWLRDWLRRHPRDAHDRPLFKLAGRTKLFLEEHIARIIEALPCPSSSSRPAKAKARTTVSAARTSASTWTRLAELTDDLSLLPS